CGRPSLSKSRYSFHPPALDRPELRTSFTRVILKGIGCGRVPVRDARCHEVFLDRCDNGRLIRDILLRDARELEVNQRLDIGYCRQGSDLAPDLSSPHLRAEWAGSSDRHSLRVI